MASFLTPKRRWRSSPLSFEERFEVKSMVEKFGVEKAEGHQLLRWCQHSLQVNEPQTPEEEEDMLGFPYRKALGVLMWTATITRPDIACAVNAWTRFWNPGLCNTKIW